MGVLFKSEHTSDRSRDYKIEIIDTDTGTLIGDMAVNQDGFRIEDTGKSKTLHDTIIAKVVSFTVQVQNQDQEDWIVDLATNEEGRYVIKLYRDTTLKFIGVLVTDSVQIDNAPKPYNFKLEAVDGIKLLKGVKYVPSYITRGAGSSSAQFSLMTYLADCFSLLPTIGQYGPSDDFFSVSLNWWSKEHIDNSQDIGNVLDKTYTFWQTFGKEQDENDFVFFDCYTIIDEICKAFNCRLYYDEGYYHMEQIGQRDAATVDEIIYSKPSSGSWTQLSTPSTDYDIDVDQTNNYHLAGGVIKFLPPLRRVLVNFDINPNYNLLPTADPLNQDRTPAYEPIGYFHVTDNTPSLTFDLSLISRFAGSAATTTDYRRVGFKLKLRVGSKVLDGYLGSLSWLDYATNTDAFVKIGFNDDPYLPISTPEIGQAFDTIAQFTTPEITESGVVQFDLLPAYSYYDGTQWVYEETTPTNVIHNWTATRAELFPTVGDNTDELITITSESSQDKGTQAFERDIILSDGYVVGRPGTMCVKTNPTTNEFVVTTGWKIGSGAGTYKIHSILLAESILSQRLKTLRIYQGVLFCRQDYISIRNRVVYDGYNLIFNKSTLRTNFDEIDVEMIEVDVDTSGITNSEIEEEPEIPGGGGESVGDPVVQDPDNPPETGQTGLITDEVLYEGDTITSFDIVEAEQDYFVTGDKIIVRDRLDGYEEKFTLAAPILDGDTTVTVESTTVTRNIVIYSPLELSPEDANRRWLYQRYENTTGSPVLSVAVTEFTLPDPSAVSTEEISKVLMVYRMTNKLIHGVGYTIDFANQEIDFMWELQDGEYVEMFKL